MSKQNARGPAAFAAVPVLARPAAPVLNRGAGRPPEIKRAPAALAAVEPDGSFAGYASLFGIADLAGDTVEPGAFAASLARRGPSGVKMLWHHDPAEPIGAWTVLREDARGLWVAGQLLTEVRRAREALALMRAGAVDGLSIGFRTVRARAEKSAGRRRLLEIDLWEISLVTFPMLPGARVAAVKTAPPAVAARLRSAAARLRRAAMNAP
jgi:hypothetical protein